MTSGDSRTEVRGAACEQYLSRRSARQAAVAQYEILHARIAGLRLLVMTAGVGVAWAAFYQHVIAAYWVGLVVILFAAIVVFHHSVARARRYAERAVQFYEAGLARIDDRWRGARTRAARSAGERFNVPHHVYAADLDLFGPDSLFELLCGARTRMGEDTLAQWLLAPATATTIRERQTSIDELRDRIELREDVAVLGDGPGAGMQPDALVHWAETANTLSSTAAGAGPLLLVEHHRPADARNWRCCTLATVGCCRAFAVGACRRGCRVAVAMAPHCDGPARD